ncbi:MaoC family dehydratase N-terminal domain-containing protein [soil metagenome]
MPLDPTLAGRSFPATAAHDVSRHEVSRFAAAIGEDDPVHHDIDVALGRGHRDLPAPPTFPIVVAFEAMTAFMTDPGVGIELRNVVHAGQRFVARRPVYAGDVLAATLTVESVRQAAGTDLIATRSDVATTAGEHVCTAYATLAHRAPAGDGS